MEIKIAIACHRQCPVPKNDIFVPIHVGHALRPALDLGFQSDDCGDNISALNNSLCELTAIYWIWKNLKADYKGLFHYRRYLTLSYSLEAYGRKLIFKARRKPVMPVVKLSKVDDFMRRAGKFADSCPSILAKYDILAADRMNNRQSNERFFGKVVERYLPLMKEAITRLFPQYEGQMNSTLRSGKLHFANMSVMRSDIFDEYCTFIFGVLFEIRRLVIASESVEFIEDMDNRKLGYVAELLTSIFISYKESHGTKVKTMPVTFLKTV